MPSTGNGQAYMISLRTVRHYAQTEDGVTTCECGVADRDPDKLAQRHTRSRKVTADLTALPAATVSSRNGCVEVAVPVGPLADDATEAALVLAFGREEYARLINVDMTRGDVLQCATYRVGPVKPPAVAEPAPGETRVTTSDGAVVLRLTPGGVVVQLACDTAVISWSDWEFIAKVHGKRPA